MNKKSLQAIRLLPVSLKISNLESPRLSPLDWAAVKGQNLNYFSYDCDVNTQKMTASPDLQLSYYSFNRIKVHGLYV